MRLQSTIATWPYCNYYCYFHTWTIIMFISLYTILMHTVYNYYPSHPYTCVYVSKIYKIYSFKRMKRKKKYQKNQIIFLSSSRNISFLSSKDSNKISFIVYIIFFSFLKNRKLRKKYQIKRDEKKFVWYHCKAFKKQLKICGCACGL